MCTCVFLITYQSTSRQYVDTSGYNLMMSLKAYQVLIEYYDGRSNDTVILYHINPPSNKDIFTRPEEVYKAHFAVPMVYQCPIERSDYEDTIYLGVHSIKTLKEL